MEAATRVTVLSQVQKHPDFVSSGEEIRRKNQLHGASKNLRNQNAEAFRVIILSLSIDL